MTIDALTMFLGWCTVINTGIFLLSTLLLITLREPIIKVHNRLFGLDEETLSLTYFQYLGNFKLAIFVLNLAPYITLKIMA